MKSFVNLGKRNKPTLWEYCSAYAFLHSKIPITKYNVSLFLASGKGEPNYHCHGKEVVEKAKELLLKEAKEGKYTKEFFEELDNVYRSRLEETKKLLEQRDFSKESNEELWKSFDIVIKNISETMKPMLIALKSQYLENFYVGELKKVLSEDEKERVFEFVSLLLTPTKLTLIQQEEELIFQIMKAFQKEEIDIQDFFTKEKDKIKELVNKCGWFHMEYMWEPKDYGYYENQIRKRIEEGLKETKSPKEKIIEIKKQQEEFFDKHPNSNFLKYLTLALQDFSFILDASKAVLIEGNYVSRPLFNEIAKRLGLNWQDLLYLVPEDVERYLLNNQITDKELVKKRRENRIVLLKDGKISVYEGDKAEQLTNDLLGDLKEEFSGISEVKGTIGYPGKVKGKVVVINSINDKHKFKPGDILVAHDGTAELTYFLTNASAIVTDQGGMICHAAIVAREMKIPSVLGTNISTKVFKDGDMVEVDAEKGIVRKIKK